MMPRRIKEIRGSVFVDRDYSQNREASDSGVKDIIINLFQVDESSKEKIRGNGEEIWILRERMIAKTKTDENGRFSFIVGHGTYSVELDIESLPEGKGAIETSRLIEADERLDADFAIRDIATIEIDHPIRNKVSMETEFTLNPIARDARGGALSANLKLYSDSVDVDVSRGMCRAVPKALKNKQFNIFVTAGKLKKQVTMDFVVPNICATAKINLAYQMGIIDRDTKIHHYLHTLTDPKRLPNEYRSRLPIKCGTRMAEEIKRYVTEQNVDRMTREEAERFMIAPVPKLDQVYISPSGFFTIHYTTRGENAVTMRERSSEQVPYYIEQIGEVMDHVKKVTCDERGFKTPLFDPGKSNFDIYVYDLKGIYGITFSSKYYNNPNSRARASSSFISLDNNYSNEKGFDKSREACMKVTAAHEFFHAVQNSYNADADTWWKEASATWNEDELYDGINDYIRYLESFFSSPHKSLDVNTYSGVVFAKYLAENLGGYETIKKIWEVQAAGYNNSLNAIDRAIKDKYPQKDLGTEFNRFTACNYIPSQYYKEGDVWETSAAIQNTYSSYPIARVRNQLDHLSSNYQLFKKSASKDGNDLKISIDEARGVRWGFKLQRKKRGEKQYSIIEIVSSGVYDRSEVIFKNFNDVYDEICLIPANLEKEKDGVTYSYSAVIQ